MENLSETIQNHIVILGWSERVKRIIAQLRNQQNFTTEQMDPILIVSPNPDISRMIEYERVYFILGETNDLTTLKRANIETAKVVLIPSSFEQQQNSDAYVILSLLAALALNPEARICVEVASALNGQVLEQIRSREKLSSSVEIVSFEAVAEKLLAQSAINDGITKVYDHLLSFDESNEIYVFELPTKWQGHSFRDLALHCFEHETILIGYENKNGLVINPASRDYCFAPTDKGWFIAYDRQTLERVLNG